MDIRISKMQKKASSLTAISSKSYVHRLIIAASLCKEDVEIVTNIMSADMEATLRVCEALSSSKKGVMADCGESGSTARFMLPLAALVSDGATLTGSGRLPERPMGPLCDVLRAAGVKVSSDHLPITVTGKPKPGDYVIAGNVSSQYISGLLFMLPLLPGDSTLTIKGKLESAAYVDMTLDVLDRFGIIIEKTAKGFRIPGGQRYTYKIGSSITAEGDWSNAAYIMAAAAVGCPKSFDSFSVSGLNAASIQGDRAVVDILKEFGVKVSTSTAAITIKGNPQKPVDVDCSQIPDLVPALAVIAAYTNGDSVFRNVGRLRMKECDRIEAVTEMLSKAGVVVYITSDPETGSENMTVCGKGPNSPEKREIVIDSMNDHRIAMAAAAIALAEDVPVVIKDAMSVNKSYPGFYEDIKKMGLTSCHLR